MTEPHAQDQPQPRRPRRRREKQFRMIFLNGRQVRVRLEPLIDGMPVDEFIRRNADPIWLHQNELQDLLQPPPADDD